MCLVWNDTTTNMGGASFYSAPPWSPMLKILIMRFYSWLSTLHHEVLISQETMLGYRLGAIVILYITSSTCMLSLGMFVKMFFSSFLEHVVSLFVVIGRCVLIGNCNMYPRGKRKMI